MRHRRPVTPRAAFTLLEMVMALTLLAVLLAVAMPFFNIQASAVTHGAGRMDAQQNARFAVNEIDRELRMAGAGVADAQPMIVMAGPNALTFNANLAARDSSDKGAVYFDPDQDPRAVVALTTASQVTLPLSGARYPDTTYANGGGTASLAETISYWVSPDSITPRSDDYILFRRVNDRQQDIVIRGVVLPAGTAPFRYFKRDSAGQPAEISPLILPIRHSAPIHGSTADTGRSALTDSIAFVRLSVSNVYLDSKAGDVIRTVESGIRIANAGLLKHATCGDSPILGVALTAVPTGGATPQVRLTWLAAVDETGGERDVERYALYRRSLADPQFGEPIAALSAGFPAYEYIDTQVQSGEVWIYGAAAQDCTPTNSPIAASAVVGIP